MTLVTLRNSLGTTAVVSTYGARLVELLAQDAEGTLENIVLGYDTEEQYRRNPDSYFGATVGRVAGRLARARFLGNGLDFTVAANEGDTRDGGCGAIASVIVGVLVRAGAGRGQYEDDERAESQDFAKNRLSGTDSRGRELGASGSGVGHVDSPLGASATDFVNGRWPRG